MFGSGGKAKLTKDGAEARKGNVKVRISRSLNDKYVKTGNIFLDKIVNGLADHSPFSLVVESGGGREKILENSGFAIGLGLKKLSEKSGKDHASYIHSDGKRMCMFSLDLSGDMKGSTIQLVGKPREFDPNDLFLFFDSLSQGMESEISGVVNLGKQKEEVEFVSKAFAGSLKEMFS
ncbi:MAG: hypothetical protein GTN38_00595 [Candidatus Aenigmarchaeota archaeon]|nr:hypothetical protein [Candidatus Aenigmarchaeota archaeon]NIP40083.1 hypothetical protein [Candidatus Aenigmarchaeota archaeon]NIQ18160.1 hypothetical protein [Candidatus Aenigmarchaeota archaeon]NIS72917.1 hypothetical protein [Candidatus Aenigmarchaeota archaeon]